MDSREAANEYAKGYTKGQLSFIDGGLSIASIGSDHYKKGYSEGYAHAKRIYESEIVEQKFENDEKESQIEDTDFKPKSR